MLRFTLLRSASACAILFASASASLAQIALPAIQVGSAPRPRVEARTPPDKPVEAAATLSGSAVTAAEIERLQPTASDTSQLLRDTPGVSLYDNGGVSRLPAIHGLADDRINTLVGGVAITSACANHMNPALSFVDPNNVGRIEVLAGLTPVSKGGDSIAGTIIVEPKSPVFAALAPPAPTPFLAGAGPAPLLPWDGRGVRFGDHGQFIASGAISSFFRSTNNGIAVSGTANVANDHWSLLYNGAWQRGTDYHMGDNGPKVLSTGFISEQHSATLAYQNNGHFLSVRGAVEDIPYQGFANQRMDMVRNHGYTIDTKYAGDYAWGHIDANAFWHHVIHKMGFLYDKQPSNMPMNTVGTDFGASVKATLPFTQLSGHDLLRVGAEFHGQRLNDWWEPVATAMMMRPFSFWNISDGRRDRVGFFAEWEAQWTPQWSTLLGGRGDVVMMNTGAGMPYDPRNPIPMGMMGMANNDVVAAALFNSRSHERTDVNFDMTALARYTPTADASYEFGYSRKTRSPNLYERYAWGVGMMATSMNGWFGDGNGYIGNLDLKPEVAHTVSATGAWRDSVGGNWEAKITPFFTYVENYIDADRVASSGGVPYVFQTLQFRNHKAELYGVDVSGRLKLYEDPRYGRFTATGMASYTYGHLSDAGQVGNCAFGAAACYAAQNVLNRGSDGLYHVMPLNARLGLEHRLGGWFSAIEVQLVESKTHVNVQRNELKTAGYALLNLRTGYEWDNLRIDLGIDNVTDARYYPPLGGFYFAQFKQNKLAGPVPGAGRSFTAELTVKF